VSSPPWRVRTRGGTMQQGDGSAVTWVGSSRRVPRQDQAFKPDAAFERAVAGAALEYVGRICVTFPADGEPTVECDRSSGIARLDRIAAQTVARAARRRPTQETAPGLRGCYRFVARLTRMPPNPVIGCWVSTETWRPECSYPFKELVSTQITLDGVGLPTGDARP
jgi:hypothetical protein